MENELSDIPIDEILERHSLCSLHAIYLRSSMYMRIIPALAGNTVVFIVFLLSFWDHPRACGEHLWFRRGAARLLGSSPRLRGTRTDIVRQWCGIGIIPALAGNTSPAGAHHPHPRDHPRACGEHSICCCASLIVVGSSPRLRGTRKREVAAWRGVGIIPALAGNTRRRCRTGHRAWDHPRACGEHLASLDQQRFDRGSSPRLRGTQTLERVCASGRGIIPALAGNTDGLTLAGIAVPGSSPRLRGTLLRSGPATPPCGIIPALAGNTLAQSWPQALGSDHPRACGEHITVSHGDIMEAGSSPRLRGTQVRDWPRNILRGIIPALAGNTL